jgi:hypothetical protein
VDDPLAITFGPHVVGRYAPDAAVEMSARKAIKTRRFRSGLERQAKKAA